MSSEEAPNSVVVSHSIAKSHASGLMMRAQSIRLVAALASIFMKPSVVRLTSARPLAVKENLLTEATAGNGKV
jgi:hypothetical protein